ncbi:MAG: deoxyribonuclease IV [Candidatus Helarchaeota archaeon]
MRLGAHMMITGGLWKAIERGEQINCESIQIFTKSNRSWKSKPISEEEREKFLAKKNQTTIHPIFVHASYLINLATLDEEKYKKSFDGMIDELQRAEKIGLPWVVLHPGSHLGVGIQKGMNRIAKSINGIHERTEGLKVKILLENVAGQGTNIGRKFEELQGIIKKVTEADRLGICFDTCHAFAGGHDFRNEKRYEALWEEFDSIIGLDKLLAFHLNDSMGAIGSRKDRHAHIGQGKIGLNAFKLLLNDKRFKDHPGVLETPKDKEMTEDVRNLKVLRGLIDK